MAGASADAEAAAVRINQEQLLHEVEHKYVLLKADFAVLERERDVAVEQKTEIASKLTDLQATVASRDAEIGQVKDELLKLRSERDQLAFQAKTTQSQADRHLNNFEELQRTLNAKNQQLFEAQRKEVEAQQKAAEKESLVEPLRNSVARVNKELEVNKQHLEWMEKQLADKNKHIHELRQSNNKITADHEELKSRHTEDIASLRKQLESARQVSKKLESSLVQTKEDVKEVQASRMHTEEQLQNELSTQSRLANLYKDAAEDAGSKVNALQQEVESLRQSLTESEEARLHQEEHTKQHVEHIFREQASASERQIEDLQEKLKEAHARLEEVQQSKLLSLRTASSMADVSSAAGAAHLEAHGLSPKELCDQLLALEADLRAERDEKEHLKICMERIVKEVNEKAPMIMGLKLDLERAKESHAQVSARYEASMQELVKCRARERQAVQDKHSFERKCEALAKSVDDLSRQVQHLLFRAHESNQSIAPGATASENLVVFKDVEELQIRNQQLLMVIRELTEAKKSRRDDDDGDADSAHRILNGESDYESAGNASPSSVSAGTNRLKTALKEIEELRVEREEERQMIAAIVKQRDMYRVLLAQADSKFVAVSETKAAETTSQDSSPNAHQASRRSSDVVDSRALRDLQKEFDTYKKEKQANFKIVQDALEQARTESSTFRLGQMHAEVEAKCNKDRFEAAEKRLQGAEEEISRLRGKFDQVNSLLIQHQKLLSESEAKLQDAVTQVRALEVQKNSAQSELSFMKKNEEKTLQEVATLRADNSNLLKLMDTNRQIDSSREERERRDQDRLSQKLTALENKLQETYDKLESNEALSGAKIAAEEQANKIAMLELTQTKDHLANAREQLARVEEQLAAAVSKTQGQEKEVELLRDQLRKGVTAASAERVSALEVELRQSQLGAQSAMEKAKSLTEGVVKYKAIAEAHQKSLAALSTETEKRRSETEAKLKALQAERDAVRGELEKARAQIKDDVVEGNKLREEIEQVTRTHLVALQESQAKQRQLQFEAESARSELAVLQEEVAHLREDVSTAQENYERELKLHASQIEKFSASRKLVQEEQTKNRALLSEISELKARVEVAESEAAGKILSIEKLLASETQAKSSLSEQNKLLHSQLEHANRELRREHETRLIQTIGTSSATVSSTTASERDHNKELDDLRSVIAYLRKEGEILSSKHELAYQENQRYRTQMSMLEATIERLREELKHMEEAASSVSTGSQASADPSGSAKQAAQLEQLDLLRESNATLREECHKYAAHVKEEKERVKILEAQIAPFQSAEALFKSQIESLKQELATSIANCNRWKQRVEQLVEKTQQVDPAEHEKVLAEKAAVAKELADLQAKEAVIRTELEALKASEGKALEEEKAKSENARKSYEKIKQFAKTWKLKAEGLIKQLADKNKELDDKVALLSVVEKKLAQAVSEKASLESKITSLEAAKAVGAAGASSALAANASWEKERQDLQERIDAETKRVTSMKEMNGRLLAGVKKLKQENTELKGQLLSTQAAADGALPTPSVTRVPTPEPVKATPPPLPAAAVPPAVTATAPATFVAKPSVVADTAPAPAAVPPSAPMRSPPRAPVPAPAAVPTLKATSTPFVPAVPAVAAPTLKTVAVPPAASVAPKAPVAVPVKAEVKEAALTPVPTPPTAVAAVTTPAPAPAAPVPAASEEDLRLVALRSMKKLKPVVPVTAAKPVPAAIAVPKPALSPAAIPSTAEAKPPLPSTTAPKPVEEKPTSAANPFGAFAPATGGFGAFGSGTAGSLVFGMPGIKLPVPASPTPTPPLAVASSVGATAFSSAPVATAVAASAPAADGVPVVTGETEAQRRSQRLARFGLENVAVPATLKRPATSDPEAATATPQKQAKLTTEDQSTTDVADSQETEDEAAAIESETADDDATQPPSAA